MALPIILLHGAIGASAQLLPFKKEFEKHFSEVYVFDFPGHGGKIIPQEKFSIPFFAESVLTWMDENNLKTVSVFGYSMGGYVALYLAKHFPDRIRAIATLGTKFEWNVEIAVKETMLLNPQKIEEKVPKFAAALKKLHEPSDWKLVLNKTAELMTDLGNSPTLSDVDFSAIKHPILIGRGIDDKMVSAVETEYVAGLLSDSQLRFFRNTQHPIETVNASELTEELSLFFHNLS